MKTEARPLAVLERALRRVTTISQAQYEAWLAHPDPKPGTVPWHPDPGHDSHYDSQGYCDNPSRGF